MEEKLNSFLDYLYTNACMLLSTYGNVPPMFFYVIKEDLVPIIIEDQNLEKEELLEFVWNTLKENNADAVVFITELYLVSSENENELSNSFDLYGSVRNHPDVKNSLGLLYYDSKQENVVLMYGDIKKDLVGRSYVESHEIMENPESFITSLFKPWV